MFYRICPKCRHKFYDQTKWAAHPCNAGKAMDDARQKAKDAIVRMGGVEALKDLPQEMQMDIIRSLGDEGLDIARKLGMPMNGPHPAKGGAPEAPTGGDADTPPAESLTARLGAADKVMKMKQELVAAGHEVQTLSAEETREEYARMKANEGHEDGTPAATTPSTAVKTKKKKTQKTEQPEA